MTANPLCVPCPGAAAEMPLAELKQHLILFVDSPPGPKTARAVYDLYLRTWGNRFSVYAPTTFGNLLRTWSDEAKHRFETRELPDLRQHDDWGYLFSDGRQRDSWLFMFHGYKPASEPGKTGFYRFEFDWQTEPQQLIDFLLAVLKIVRCVSGYGGYVWSGHGAGPHARSSLDQRCAWAWRYWGVEMAETDVTAASMLEGYKCPSWLTVIGPGLEQRAPEAVSAARVAAYRSYPTPGGVVLQAGPSPQLGDRNRQEPLQVYEAIAHALIPLQMKTHSSFGGSRWTDTNTMAWLRRFTNPPMR